MHHCQINDLVGVGHFSVQPGGKAPFTLYLNSYIRALPVENSLKEEINK